MITDHMNGNVRVQIFEDGTKIRSYDGKAVPKLPESADIKISDYCDAGCPHCFVGTTLIATVNGNKPIDQIQIGDQVYSYNFDKAYIEPQTVEALLSKNTFELIEIELENGHIIKCTPDHLIFTKARGWVKAEDLFVEDDLFNLF